MNCMTKQDRKQQFLGSSVPLSVFVLLCLFFLSQVPCRAETDGPGVSGFADVKAMAAHLADQPYKPPEKQTPEFLLTLT
jgi:hypothetical protein